MRAISRRAFGAVAAASLLTGMSVARATTDASTRIRYGPSPDHVGDLYLPADGSELPVVVMIHGGGWLQKYALDGTRGLAEALVPSGIAVWNIEYRRVGGSGGWPMTLADVVHATDALGGAVQTRAGGRLDLDRVHVAGHSAGGHLAAWLAGRPTMGPYAPGPEPAVRLRGVTTMAGVFDPATAVTVGGDRYLPGLLGGTPAQVPERYRLAAPIEQLPIGVPVTAFHGDVDRTVSVRQSIDYVAAATRLGDPATLRVLSGEDHLSIGDPTSTAWNTVRGHIVRSAHRPPSS